MEKREKGVVTVFLSLLFVLLIVLIGSILESASIQVSKNYKKTDVDRGLESVFAEYQKDLLETYEIFALDGTYETGTFSWETIYERLEAYGVESSVFEAKKVRFLTDQDGAPFYEQATAYMKHCYGMDLIQELIGEAKTWESKNEEAATYERWQEESSIEDLGETSKEALTEENPLTAIQNLQSSNLLELILPEETKASTKGVTTEDLPSGRSLRQGIGYEAKESDTLDALFFGEYLLEKMGNAVKPNEDGALSYQLEYLLIGKGSDLENLEGVVKELLLFRLAVNYGYLLTDTEKCTEAEVAALALSTLLCMPEACEAYRQALLIGWAYGESIVDLQALLEGKQTALVKSKEGWQLGLTDLVTLATGGRVETKEVTGGIDYKGYLRILLYFKSREEKTMRALDLIEADFRLTKGFSWFRVDNCIVGLTIHTTSSLRKGITYDFLNEYEYQNPVS